MFGRRKNGITLLEYAAATLLALVSPLCDARAGTGATDPNGLLPNPLPKSGTAQKLELEKTPWDFVSGKLTLHSRIASAYVTDLGLKVGGDGPVIQNGLTEDIGKRWSLTLWNNLNPNDSNGNETDAIIRYKDVRLCELNDHDVLGYAGAEFYTLSEKCGGNDLVFTAGADWKGDKYGISAYLKYLTGLGERDDGFLTYVNVSREYPLSEEPIGDDDPRKDFDGGMKLSVSPSVSAAFGSHYFVEETGLYHVTPGVKIKLKDGKTTFSVGCNLKLGIQVPGNEAVIWADCIYPFGGRPGKLYK